MPQILLLDNYDSFTYNLSHYLKNLGADVDVVRNDELGNDLNALLSNYDKVVLSPGPGLPEDAGAMMDVIKWCDGRKQLLGVCLGMQGIGIHLGSELYNLKTVKHGVQEDITLQNSALFKGLAKTITVGLYHSWAVPEVGGDYSVVAKSESDVVMAIQNSDRKLYGVQFHPESIMTPHGMTILENFLQLK